MSATERLLAMLDVYGDACDKPRDLADRIRKLARKEAER